MIPEDILKWSIYLEEIQVLALQFDAIFNEYLSISIFFLLHLLRIMETESVLESFRIALAYDISALGNNSPKNLIESFNVKSFLWQYENYPDLPARGQSHSNKLHPPNTLKYLRYNLMQFSLSTYVFCIIFVENNGN